MQIDISDEADDDSPAVIAPDVPGNAYELSISTLQLTISYEQMNRIYRQIRPWFEDDNA
jgi:hypothetical protein